MADVTVQSLDELLQGSRQIRRRFEPQMFLNLAYFLGQQWVSWDGRRIYEPQLDDSRVKVVDNRIRPTVRTEIAKMTKTRPVWVGVPKDSSDKEASAARLREAVFEHDWKTLDMTRKLRAGLMWSRIAGSGFLKAWWDSSLGNSFEVVVGKDGRPMKDTNQAPMKPEILQQLDPQIVEDQQLSTKTLAVGDVCVEVRTPFEIFPDPLASEEGMESCEWVIEETVLSREKVKQRFKEDLEPDTDASYGAAESRMPSMGIGVRGDERYKGVKVREYWCLPNSEHPKGKHAVWAKEKVLLEEDIPCPFLPYVMFRGAPVPGRFWPDAVVSDMISPQTELNKRKAQIAENAERVGNSPLAYSAENADVEQWQGLPGEKLRFQDTGSPNAMPQFLQVPELGTYIREDVDRIQESLRETSGHPEVSAGSVPAGVTAASAINLLIEQADTVLGPDSNEMEETLTGLGRRVLELRRRYCTTEQLIRIAGEDGAWDIQAFKGDQLSTCEHDAVQAGSGLPQSKAAKQAAIQETLTMFAQMQIPLAERDLRKVLQEYEVGGLEKFFATIGNDERQIARENQRMANGEQLQINSYDDDELHVDGHREFQKGASYDELPPERKQIFEMHVLLHLRRQSDRAMAGGQIGGAVAQGQFPPTGPPGAAAALPPDAGAVPPPDAAAVAPAGNGQGPAQPPAQDTAAPPGY